MDKVRRPAQRQESDTTGASHRGGAVRLAHPARLWLTFAAVAAGALLVWRLRTVLLLLFAAVVLSLFIRAVAKPIEAHTPIKGRWSTGLAVVLILGLLSTAITFFGWSLEAQFADMAARLPGAWTSLQQQLASLPLGSRLVASLQEAAPETQRVLSAVRAYASSALGVIGNLLLVVAAGIYLALEPKLYEKGLVSLLPKRLHGRVQRTMADMGGTLQSWLLAQGAAMVLVGLATGLGYWALGVPAPIALGLLAGLADFVPLVGPVFAATPAVLLAAPMGFGKVGLVILVVVVVQQLEGDLLLPLLQKRIVSLPPVVTLFALVAFGVVFGPLGVLLATPLTAALFVAVRQLYVRETLGEQAGG